MKTNYGAGQFIILVPIATPGSPAGPANVDPLYKVVVVIFVSVEGLV